MHSAPSVSSLPKFAFEKGTSVDMVWLNARSLMTLEIGMSATSFLHCSFLQEISAVVLWFVQVQTGPQSSQHFCLAKLKTACNVIFSFGEGACWVHFCGWYSSILGMNIRIWNHTVSLMEIMCTLTALWFTSYLN